MLPGVLMPHADYGRLSLLFSASPLLPAVCFGPSDSGVNMKFIFLLHVVRTIRNSFFASCLRASLLSLLRSWYWIRFFGKVKHSSSWSHCLARPPCSIRPFLQMRLRISLFTWAPCVFLQVGQTLPPFLFHLGPSSVSFGPRRIP